LEDRTCEDVTGELYIYKQQQRIQHKLLLSTVTVTGIFKLICLCDEATNLNLTDAASHSQLA